MGNQQAKPLAKKRNQSFDIGDFRALDKILPSNVGQSSIDALKSSMIPGNGSSGYEARMKNSTSMHEMPSISNPSTYLRPKMSIKEQNAKLQKLTKTNDQLRKQLMEINKKLAEQLQKKKMPTLMASHNEKSIDKTVKQRSNSNSNSSTKTQEPNPKDKHKATALKKQLQNAYSQVNMYKKQIQALKKNDSHQNDMKLQTSQDKVTAIQADISNVQKSLESIRAIVRKQKDDIEQYEKELDSEEVQQSKREITMLKERLKKWKQVGRKKEKQEKVRHELLIQMERKVREMNEEYVPEIRNWAAEQPTTKSRIANISANKAPIPKKKQSSPNQKPFRYMPSKLQLQQAQSQLKKQKQTHQQFHKKIDNQLKKRNDYRQERTRIQGELQTLYKTLQNIQYKKERYIQLIMGNVTGGGEGMDELLSIGEEQNVVDGDVVSKGDNLQGQLEFSDLKTIPHIDKLMPKLKIITLHVWTTSDKGHITALQFYYTDGDSFFVGKKSAQPTAPTQKHTFQLSQGDYLRNVMGIFNSKTKFLEFIVFESVKGKVLKVGKESFKNTNFNLRIGKGQRPAMVSGACLQEGGVWRINRLDFFIKAG